MSAIVVVVVKEATQPPQVLFVQYDNVVEQLAPAGDG